MAKVANGLDRLRRHGGRPCPPLCPYCRPRAVWPRWTSWRAVRSTAALIPGCRPATDYRQVMDDCEAVLIALPHHLHHPVGMDCLTAASTCSWKTAGQQ